MREPVRLGIFRTLFFEAYRLVHGELSYKALTSLTVHGILSERLKIRLLGGIEEVHTGVDLVLILEYPYNEGKIVVPLFIIAKVSPENVKKIKLKYALNRAANSVTAGTNVKRALEEFINFTRIALQRTIGLERKLHEENCIIGHHEDIPIYADLVCSVLRPIFVDIYDLYVRVAKNEKLKELNLDDWIEALLHLAVPITQITIAKGARPPSPPGGALNLSDVLMLIRQKAIDRIKSEAVKIRDSILSIKRSYLEPRLRENVNKIIEKYKKLYERESERQKLKVGMGW